MRRAIRRGHAWAIIAIIAIVATAALIEGLAGRPPICPCGHVRLWTGDVHGPENSQQIADWYTPSHILHGLLFYGVLWLAARRWPVGLRLIARRLPVAGSVALGLALELIALAAIRDNLTLNILMLVHPVAAIRIWQAG